MRGVEGEGKDKEGVKVFGLRDGVLVPFTEMGALGEEQDFLEKRIKICVLNTLHLRYL